MMPSFLILSLYYYYWVGSIFDYAVNSLSKVLGIPLILGSSYANTVIVNLFSGKPGYVTKPHPCDCAIVNRLTARC